MAGLIELKAVDKRFYESRLREFLPDRIIDIHTHIWLASDVARRAPAGLPRTVTWPDRVARDNPIGDLVETYRLLLPGKKVTPLVFGYPVEGGDLDTLNGYVASVAADRRLPAPGLTSPAWSAAELEDRVIAGGFLGVKPYLTCALAYLPAGEIRIHDFLPPHHLEVLDRHGWIAMLHIPRPGPEGLTRRDIEDILGNNGARLFTGAVNKE